MAKKYMENVLIPNPELLEKKVRKLKKGGSGNLQVRSNFDGSLTLTYINGKKIPSIIARLRQGGGYISDSYAAASQKLADTYRPIEYDQSINIETKKAKMLEWWTNHYELLKKVGMSKQVLDELTKSEKANFRKGADNFFALLKNNNIPMIILSSSGIGNTIPIFLKKEGLLSDNISILSNEIQFDQNGKMTGVKKPIIHTYNKNEISVSQLANYSEINRRKNILLLGDVLGDLKMTEGFDFEEIIRVGFLSEDIENHLEEYEKNFDIVILNDGDMNYINELLSKIINEAPRAL